MLALGLRLRALSNMSLLFAGPVYDLVTRRELVLRRRIRPVYLWGCLFALATFRLLRFAVGATPWWHHVAPVIAGM